MKPVAATIVAKNYLPLARAVCRSFLEHHPDGRFFVLLVDEFDGEFEPTRESFELVTLDALELPWGDLFLYQYSILELSTAVKPFLLRHLLDKHALESLLYLDPDLYITSPLTSVYGALSRSSIVLTPHMFTPPPDDGKNPTEADIMLSGVYNLGFLGIRNDKVAADLLKWWGDRLATKCVVDLTNALFVDQRWMDLAPSYFDGVEILRDPTLNVAYWNLHERKLDAVGDRFLVGGNQLGFFHFSGFNPGNLETLSKHQTRHKPNDNPALLSICKRYADELFENGYKKFSRMPVAFNALSNGVRLGKLTQYAVRKAIERKINVPSPRKYPEAFCRFLMTPNCVFDRRAIAPILVALEHYRPDVKAAFPSSFETSDGADAVRGWVRNSGGKEEGIAELFQKFGHLLDRLDVVQHALACWRRRGDLQKAFPDAFVTEKGTRDFAAWIDQYGTVEDAFASGDGDAFISKRRGLLRVLMLYLQDNNLQNEFKFIFTEKDRVRFIKWLYAEACPREIVAPEDVAWFDGFVEGAPDIVAEVTLGHGSWLRANLVGGGTVFDLRQIKDMLNEIRCSVTEGKLMKWYTSSRGSDVWAQAEQFYYYNSEVREKFPRVFADGVGRDAFVRFLSARLAVPEEPSGTAEVDPQRAGVVKSLFGWIKKDPVVPRTPRESKSPPKLSATVDIRQVLADRAQQQETIELGVNVAGYFHAPTGMGESARSMARTLTAGSIRHKNVPLPSTHLDKSLDVTDLQAGRLLSSYEPAYKVNLIIANGDDYPYVRCRLPYSFWQGKRNIGYWVWETESLPDTHGDSQGLTEIWTPSEYSAAAIRKTVSVPVAVVPHVIDFNEIDKVEAARSRFGISESQTAYGYFFDCKSVMERKNPFGLLRAFRQAFSTQDRRAVLVLKVGSSEYAQHEFAQLKKAAEGMNVVWITDVLSREDTLSLMKSLDVYVSLHRSEGFGLTMAEAMALGIPVVATAYSGNIDFMSDQNSCLVQARVIQTTERYGPYPIGTSWGDPDESQAASLMADLMDVQLRQTVGNAASRSIRERLNAEAIARSILRNLLASNERTLG